MKIVVVEKTIREIAYESRFNYKPEYKEDYIRCAEKFDAMGNFKPDELNTREEKIAKFFRLYGVKTENGFRIVNIMLDC